MGAPNDSLSLYNLALLQINQKPITTFADTDKDAAIVGSLVYDQTRQEVLQAIAWNCSRKYGTVTLSTDQTPLFDFSGAYALPPDLVALREVGQRDDQWCPSNKYSYDLAGRMLYYGDVNNNTTNTPVQSLSILYTTDMSDVTQMDALFKKVLIYALARDIAMPLTGDAKIFMLAKGLYDEALAVAEASNKQQRPIRVVDRNPFDYARDSNFTDPWDGQLLVPPSARPT